MTSAPVTVTVPDGATPAPLTTTVIVMVPAGKEGSGAMLLMVVVDASSTVWLVVLEVVE